MSTEASVDWELGSRIPKEAEPALEALHRAGSFSCHRSCSPSRDGLVTWQCSSVCAEFVFNLSTHHFGMSQGSRGASLEQGGLGTWNRPLSPFPCGIFQFEYQSTKHLGSLLQISSEVLSVPLTGPDTGSSRERLGVQGFHLFCGPTTVLKAENPS